MFDLNKIWDTKFFPFVIIALFFSFSRSSEVPENSNFPSGDSKKSIKIGFLISNDTSKDDLSKQAVQTVSLALGKINKSGGINGKKLEVVIRSCDGLWGAGSKQSVDLIYTEDVCAIVGFVDGRNAHLAEQVATKSQVVFLSTFSPDPTLSKINIPWFFSSIYNADQQAELLVSEIFEKQNLRNLVVVSSDDYDDSFLAKSFLKEVEKKNYPPPGLVAHRAGKENFKQIVSQISESETDGIVFFGNRDNWSSFMYFLKSANSQTPVFCPIKELDFEMSSLSSIPVYSLIPDSWNSEKGKQFKNDFREMYGYTPGISASFVYDGILALCEAIKTGGTDRLKIQESLFNVNLNGVSGDLSFHPSGKRLGNLQVYQLHSTLFAH